jgi:hypothetical protein
MNRFQAKMLQSVRQFSHLLDLAECGLSPSEVKRAIIETLSPYFEHQNVLHDLAVEVLAPEAVNAQRIEHDPWVKMILLHVLQIYRAAAIADEEACFRGIASWQQEIYQGLSEFCSLFYLELDKSDLPLDEFKYEVFRNIGTVVEASLQPLLRELLLQVRIARRKQNVSAGIRSMSLGTLVGELHDTSGLPDLVAPPPQHIRLNQWRNMAQHHSSWVHAGKIIARFGTEANEQVIEFSRDELLDALKRIGSIYSTVRMAHMIFTVDNMDKVQPYLGAGKVRDDIKIFSLATALATQGFELKDISIEEQSVTAAVQDVTDCDPNARVAHATQFPYSLWCHFPKDEAAVVYLDRAGTPKLKITAKGKDCESVKKEEIPFEALADRVKLEIPRDQSWQQSS